MGKRTVAPTIAITVAITILIAIYDCYFGARRAPTIAIAIQILSAAFFCTSLCPFVSCSCFLWLAMLALHASCVTVGGPLKLHRCSKKSKSIFVTAVAAEQTAVAAAVVDASPPVVASASPQASVRKKQKQDPTSKRRSRQSSRSPAARREEKLKAKLKQQHKAMSGIAPLLREIQRRDDTIAALREELAAERAACHARVAAASASNWKEGVAFGRKGLGTPPTPKRPGRAPTMELHCQD